MAALTANIVAGLLRIYSRCRRNKQNIPLPPVCHVTMDQSETRNRYVFVIGDVHGCLTELTELLDAASFIHPNCIFMFVGDLVNKGPDSPGVLRLIRRLHSDGCAFAVRGNHDESAIREILRKEKNDSYTPSDQYLWTTQLSKEDKDFLCNLPYTIEIPHLNTLIVHAGLVPGKCLELQRLNDLTNMRNLVKTDGWLNFNGVQGTNKIDRGEKWAALWNGPRHVYFGHDARRLLQTDQYSTGLDTGCVYGGSLTGVFVNGCTKMLSVNAKTVYVSP